ncbi:MAG: hypothetical protein MUC48_01625 [Leptolyngbya sp. Prado105]|nr:hypothetical protein [Leptolyngbya sp. Prado105]
MQFYWTMRYEFLGESLDAKPGTALLVIEYQERYEGAEDAYAVASVLADTLIEGRSSNCLRAEPDLVIQVHQH